MIVLASFSSVVASQQVKFNQRNFKNLVFQGLSERLDEIRDRVQTRFKSLFSEHFSSVNVLNNEINIPRLLFVLVFTIFTEFFAYVGFIKSPVILLFFISVLINSITNPLTNLVYYYIYDNVFVLETLVVLVESFMIFAILPEAAFISFMAWSISCISEFPCDAFVFTASAK